MHLKMTCDIGVYGKWFTFKNKHSNLIFGG